MLGVSYLLTTHNESRSYLTTLIKRVLQNIDQEDEVIILDDFSDDPDTVDVLAKVKENRPDIKIIQHHLNGDFAGHKNFGKSLCTKDYVFQIDGDECPHENLLRTLKETLLFNPTVDLYRVPRINVVIGLTDAHVQQWGWIVDENSRVNFPDYQDRIFKNVPTISWQNKVHEKIVGHTTHSELPAVEDYCLLHVKDILRQKNQNEFYSTL